MPRGALFASDALHRIAIPAKAPIGLPAKQDQIPLRNSHQLIMPEVY
ncbi:hypothetical protein [Methylobacter sp. BBA5.1]|nr:hypothetical protein [Methylobacter sp. BBA5.1]